MIYTTITGYLAKDAEEQQIGERTALKFRIGSTRSRRDKNGQKVTEWVEVLAFRTAVKQFLTKGKFVIVFGELEAWPWTSQNGQVNAGLQMVAERIEFGPRETASEAPQSPQAPKVAQQPTQVAPMPTAAQNNDELPF